VNSRKAVIPPDALTIDLLNALLTINKLANNTTTELEAMLNTIKLNIVEVAYSNIPTLRESLEPYVAMTPSLFNATDKDGDENEKEDTI